LSGITFDFNRPFAELISLFVHDFQANLGNDVFKSVLIGNAAHFAPIITEKSPRSDHRNATRVSDLRS